MTARPRLSSTTPSFGELSGGALDLCESKPAIKIVVGADDAVPAGQVRYADYVADQPENDPPIDFDPHIYDETTRLYTSGTTNRPKGVPINNINEVLSAHDVMMHFPLGPTDRTMNMTPWFHRGGIHSGGPCPTLYAGGEVVILRDFAPKRCLNYAREVQHLVPDRCTDHHCHARPHAGAHPVRPVALRGIVTMGAPFEKSACEKYMKLLTPNIFNGYGTTESFWNTFLRPFDLPDNAGSAGRSCTDDEVRIVKLREDGSHSEPDDLVPHDNVAEGENHHLLSGKERILLL